MKAGSIWSDFSYVVGCLILVVMGLTLLGCVVSFSINTFMDDTVRSFVFWACVLFLMFGSFSVVMFTWISLKWLTDLRKCSRK